jgi:hypothetical protein
MLKHLLFSTIFMLAGSLLWGQSIERMVIVEEFTNASCAPCAAQNPAFNDLLFQNTDQVIPIKYQTAFPGFDPYNQQNPGEVATRRSLYAVSGVPTASIDGVVPGNNYGGGGLSTWIDPQGNGYNGGPYGYNQAVLDYAASVPTTIGVEVTASVPNFDEMGTVTVSITNADTLPFTDNSNLFVALLEKENEWADPPGSTNEAEFYDVMRKMYPSAQGLAIGEIPADTTLTFELDVMLPDYLYNLEELSFVAFVQSQSDRTIYNAGQTDRLPVPAIHPKITIGDNTSSVEGSLCDRIFTGEIEVINEGTIPIAEFDMVLNYNGSATITESVTDTLSPGENTIISFDPLELEPGLSTLTFSAENVNGASGPRVINTLSTVSESISVQAAEQTDEIEISYGFENDQIFTQTPAGMILDNPSDFMRIVTQQNVPNSTGPVGGYGESDQSLLVNFYFWDTQDFSPDGEIVLSREFTINPDATELLISFDRAHAQWPPPSGPATNDGLEGYIYYDCGENWTQV